MGAALRRHVDAEAITLPTLCANEVSILTQDDPALSTEEPRNKAWPSR